MSLSTKCISLTVNGLHLLLVSVKGGGKQRWVCSFPFSNQMTPYSAYYTYIPYISIMSDYCPWSNFSQIHQCLSAQSSNGTEVIKSRRRRQDSQGHDGVAL